MEKHTKEDPGCYHSALKYLEELTGLSAIKTLKLEEVQLKETKKLANGKIKNKLKYYSYNITVVDKQGNNHPYILNSMDYKQRKIDFDYFLVKVLRPIAEFNIPIKEEGKYNECLGGGWTTKTRLYSINGNYFANIDCSCGNFL